MSTGTVDNNFHVFNLLSGYFEGIQQSGARNDGRTVLVVVHDRNIQFLFQALFYLETFGCLDVFQVDTSESRCDGFYGFDELVRVFFVDFDVEYIDTGINLEQQSFTLHDRLTAHGPDDA